MQSRCDWHIARTWLEATLAPGARILDVGCFDGSFLEPLVGRYSCNGIEIHPEASKRAEQKGIQVIGKDFSSLRGAFDCISAIDVIEHVERPRNFISDCLAALTPGGYLLLSTGNLDAVAFRIMGSRYWYCAIGEHISFLSKDWFAKHGTALGYQILRQTTFAHGDASWSRRLREIAINLFYRSCRPAFRALRRLGLGGKNARSCPELADHPPRWLSARDHVMVLLAKA